MILALARPLRIVHSTLCTRVLLNLRGAAACSSGPATFSQVATLVFEQPDGLVHSEEEVEVNTMRYHE